MANNIIAVPLASELVYSKLDPKTSFRKAVFLYYPAGIAEERRTAPHPAQ